MSKMKSLYLDIYDDLCSEILSMHAIARKHEVPFSWVQEVWDQLCYDEGMEKPYEDQQVTSAQKTC